MTTSADPNPYSAPAPVSDTRREPLPYQGSVLRQGWQVYLGHWGTIATLIGIIWIPVGTATSYFVHQWLPSEDEILSLIAMPIEFVAESLGTGAVIAVGIAAALGDFPTVKGSLQRSLSVWGKFVWTYFLCTFFIVLGMFALVVPGLFLAVRLSLADCVVVNEGAWGGAAISRSFDLTAGSGWAILRLCLVLFTISIVSWSAYSILLALVPSLDTWQSHAIFSLVVNMIEAYPAICFYLFYRRRLQAFAP